jgi:ankyrin repeat protein
VAKRLRQILNTRKGSPYHFHNGETELTHCLDFLHRFRHRKEVLPALQRMVEKWEILSDKEVFWITDQLEFFDHADLRRETHCLPAVVKFVDSDHPVFEACERGGVEALRMFLDQGTSVYSHDTNRSLSSVALRNGHLEILKLLVEYGLNLERPVHGFHEFPILRALRAEKWELADYILSQGIDLNRRDDSGSSIFNIACYGFVPVDWLSRMIDLGGDVNDRSRSETPIFSAVRGNAVGVLELLVSCGADINAIKNDGSTPLILAARGGKAEAAKWLIDHGADLRHCQYRDRDALHWARENKHPEVEALLLLALGRDQ